jgi:phosphoglycolate phosphatase-like HAD superfamily hydrolase
VRRSLPPEINSDKNVHHTFQNFMIFIKTFALIKLNPTPVLVSMLNYLWDNDIHTAVFSNKSGEFTKYIVNSLIPKHSFEIISGAGMAYRKTRPHRSCENPEIRDINAEEGLFVGDLRLI